MKFKKPQKNKPQRYLIFLANYLGDSRLDVIVYDKTDPSTLPTFIKLYADCGQSFSDDSAVVLPSQYYPDIIHNECHEFDDIPEDVLTAAVFYADTNKYSFPNEEQQLHYIAMPKYNLLSFALPIN